MCPHTPRIDRVCIAIACVRRPADESNDVCDVKSTPGTRDTTSSNPRARFGFMLSVFPKKKKEIIVLGSCTAFPDDI